MIPEKSDVSTAESNQTPSSTKVCRRIIDRPQFRLSTLIALISLTSVLFALQPVQNIYSLSVLAVMALTWTFGCRRTKQAVILIAPCFLLPYVWLLLIDYPWNSNRWNWIRNWACLPGMLPGSSLLLNERAPLLVAAILTSAGFLIVVSIIRFWSSSRWWVFATVLAFNVFSSLGLYHAFRA
jgi:hypothetical protein